MRRPGAIEAGDICAVGAPGNFDFVRQSILGVY